VDSWVILLSPCLSAMLA